MNVYCKIIYLVFPCLHVLSKIKQLAQIAHDQALKVNYFHFLKLVGKKPTLNS